MKTVFLCFVAVVVFVALANILGWFGNGAQVVQQEFSPSAMLQKYQWFKDASAQLDAKVADMQVYDKRFRSLKEAYGSEPRSKWSREDREQFNIWQSELAGIKASYNSLAGEYNAQMAKFNWRFANAGQLPAGATVPLPREYKPYETE
jgi:hypothetical protein